MKILGEKLEILRLEVVKIWEDLGFGRKLAMEGEYIMGEEHAMGVHELCQQLCGTCHLFASIIFIHIHAVRFFIFIRKRKKKKESVVNTPRNM